MGPKWLAALSVGAFLAAGVFYFVGRPVPPLDPLARRTPSIEPLLVPESETALASPSVSAPIAPAPERIGSLPWTDAAAHPSSESRSVTLTDGTLVQVRLEERLATDHNVPGDSFVGSLDQPLVVNGLVVAKKGAHVTGRIAAVSAATMALELASITAADGQRIQLRTAHFIQKGDATGARTDVQARITFRIDEPVTITTRPL